MVSDDSGKLESTKVSELCNKAESLGIDHSEIDACFDSDDPRRAVLGLIDQQQRHRLAQARSTDIIRRDQGAVDAHFNEPAPVEGTLDDAKHMERKRRVLHDESLSRELEAADPKSVLPRRSGP